MSVGKLQDGDRIRIKYYKRGKEKPYRVEDVDVISVPAGKDYFVVNNGKYTKTVDWIWKRQGLIQIFKIRNKEVESMREIKITREQLLEECKEHGTSMDAAKVIAEKYGLTVSTIYTKMGKDGIRKELGTDGSKKTVRKSEVGKITGEIANKLDKVLNTAVIEEPARGKTEKPILQVAYMKGVYADYKIHEKTVQLVDKRDELCFVAIPKTTEALVGLIMELDELLARIEEEAS